MNRNRRVFLPLALVAICVFAWAPTRMQWAQTQKPAPAPITIIDRLKAGKSERVDLPNGGYKLVDKNKAGQVISEEVYEVTGQMIRTERKVQETFIESAYPDGKPAEVKIESPPDDTIGNFNSWTIGKEEHVKYGPDGKPTENITYKADKDGNINYRRRTVTTWPEGSGPNGVTRTERYDEATDTWRRVTLTPSSSPSPKPSPSPSPSASPDKSNTSLTGNWARVSNGKKQSGFRIQQANAYVTMTSPDGNKAFDGNRQGAIVKGTFYVPVLNAKFAGELRVRAGGNELEAWSRQLTQLNGNYQETGEIEFRGAIYIREP